MPVRIVRLGSPRQPGEGPRLGTVRRPPRGVRRAQFSSGNWYDVWLPNLAPSAALVAQAQRARTATAWRAFARKYTRELAAPDRAHLLSALALLSRTTNFSVGCYCDDESRCHRGLLRTILERHGAEVE